MPNKTLKPNWEVYLDNSWYPIHVDIVTGIVTQIYDDPTKNFVAPLRWSDFSEKFKVRKIKDNVNSPSHYNQSGIECIDAIRATLGPEGFQAYCKGNAMKYLWRYKYKNGQEDLEKAEVYLNWMIESMREEKE